MRNCFSGLWGYYFTIPAIDCIPVYRSLRNQLCVSSVAAFVMRAGLSMGEAEQPSPSNRLHAA